MFIFCANISFAQDGLLLEAQIKIENGNIRDTRVVIEKDGKRLRTMDAEKRFDLELDYNSTYLISFEKDGYVTKRLRFDTSIPEGREEFGFMPFGFIVTLFKQYDDINTMVYNQPVAMISYNDVVDAFDYNTDYTKSIQAQLEEIQEQVQEKIEEEARQIEEEEARQKELEKQVSKIVSSGDKSLENEDFEEAIKEFEEAKKLKPDDPQIEEKLKKAREGADRQRQDREKNKEYEKLMLEARDALKQYDLPKASDRITEAKKYLLPTNKEGKKAYEDFEKELQQQRDRKRQYDDLVNQSREKMKSGDPDGAKELIKQAKELKPDGDSELNDLEKEVDNAINERIKEEQAQQETQKAFEDKIAEGDKSLKDENFDEARKAYEDANALDPDNTVVAEKLKQLEDAIAAKAKEKEQEELEKKQKRV